MLFWILRRWLLLLTLSDFPTGQSHKLWLRDPGWSTGGWSDDLDLLRARFLMMTSNSVFSTGSAAAVAAASRICHGAAAETPSAFQHFYQPAALIPRGFPLVSDFIQISHFNLLLLFLYSFVYAQCFFWRPPSIIID
jgi:hypothetical protein